MNLEPFRGNAGPSLIGLSVVGFILTRIIIWLPLGILGSWINGMLYSVIFLALIAGIGITVLNSKRKN